MPDSCSIEPTACARVRGAAAEHEPDKIAQQREHSPDKDREKDVQGTDDGGFATEAVNYFEEDKRRAGRSEVDAIAERGFGEFRVTINFAKGKVSAEFVVGGIR